MPQRRAFLSSILSSQVISSRIIAEQLGKEHKNVVRDLEKILESSVVSDLRPLIISSEYKDLQNKPRKEYLLTEEGFTLYMFNIQGYNDFKIAYIREFKRMQNDLVTQFKLPSNYKEALVALVQAEEEKEALTARLEETEPSHTFVQETFIPVEGSILIRDFAKLVHLKDNRDIGEKKLYEWLRLNKIVTKANTPMQKYIEMGIFEMKNSTSASHKLVTYITNKGQTYLHDRIVKEYN
jgi:Rha family phage regulatory protein